MQKLTIWLATGFGLGMSPVASGTAGSLIGVLLALVLSPLPLAVQCVIASALAIVAIPICGAAEDYFGRKDDGRIVADEYLTFPICVLGLPWMAHPWLLVVAFVINRIMDIVKIPPARQSQSLQGGLGIVVDDVIACLYALLLNHGVWYVARRFLMAPGS